MENKPQLAFTGPWWTSFHFVDDVVMDDQFKHYLGQMFFGMTDLGECLEVARKLNSGDEQGWISAWSEMAGQLQERAEASEQRGKRVSAASAYLRAASYWRASLMHFAFPDDPRMRGNSITAYECYDRYLELSGYPGERVMIPYEGSELYAYLYRAPDAPAEAPLLIFNQGRDAWPEDTRWVYDNAIRRGIHCLAVHGPGQGLSVRLNNLPFRPDWEKVITPVVDVAVALPGVDADRIGLMGLSFGGYLAPRATAFEHRIKVCVADPGVLDWGASIRGNVPPEFTQAFEAGQEIFNSTVGAAMADDELQGWFLRDSLFKHGVDNAYDLFAQLTECDLTPYVHQIECETLVMDGTEEKFSSGQAFKLFEALQCPKEYLLFDESTTAQLHCQNGATGVAAESMFDWLDERL